MIKKLIFVIILTLKLLPSQNKCDSVYAQMGEEFVYLGNGEWGLYLGDGYWDGNIYEFDYTTDQIALLDFFAYGLDAFSGNFGFNFDENGDIQFWNDPFTYQENEAAWAAYMNEYAQTAYNESEAWAAQFQDFGGYVDWNAQDWYDYLESIYNNTNNETPPSCPTNVIFSEDAIKKYGFDKETDPLIPWKSIKSGETDKVQVTITPAGQYGNTYFKNATPANNVTLKVGNTALTQAQSASFEMTLTAASNINNDESEIQANCGSLTGNNVDKLNVVAYSQLNKKVAIRVINSAAHSGYAGYTSAGSDAATLKTMLNTKYYNQAIVNFSDVDVLTPLTIDFDLNSDYKLDNPPTSAYSLEEREIIFNTTNQADAANYDHVIFLVNNPLIVVNGTTRQSDKFSFVHVPQTPDEFQTIAHEIGHGLFSFSGDYTTPDYIQNLMYHEYNPQAVKLRKFQWDFIH